MTLVNLSPLFDFLGGFVGGPEIALILVGALIKIGLIVAHVLGIIPLIILFERKIIGFIQDRPGPNRAGPWGILQGIADGLKLLMKEGFIPAGADRSLYLLAPMLFVVPAFLALAIVPWGPVVEGQVLLDFYTLFGLQGLWTPASQMALAVTNPNIGILYVFAITSVGVYGITLAGWSSENKWSLLGGIRASAQMVSYEIALSLSIIGVLLISGSLNLYDIIGNQTAQHAGGDAGILSFWQWNIFAQPVAFLLFVVAMFAETNRLPFDLAEGEAELTGGFHTEYSSMKFAMFFLAEYINMITVAAVCATLFLGGYQLVPEAWVVAVLEAGLAFVNDAAGIALPMTMASLLTSLGAPLGLAAKIAFFLFIFIMIRGMWPRMRYDQVMDLGWKVMLVAGLLNLIVTAIGIAVLVAVGASRAGAGAPPEVVEASINSTIQNFKWVIGLVTFAGLVVADRMYASRRRARMKGRYQNYLKKPSDSRGAEPLAT